MEQTYENYHKEYYKKNREKVLAYRREYRQRPEVKEKQARLQREWREKNRIRNLYNSIKSKASFHGILFDLEESDLIVPTVCPVLGIPLRWDKRSKETTPSVDRLIPSKGYVKGNIHIISGRANRLKNDASLEELEKVVEYVRKSLQSDENVL